MQNEIEQLKNDKNSLQMALSSAKMTISDLKERQEEYQEEVSVAPSPHTPPLPPHLTE
jgi:FtsZ-binding cell division protein ZapB